jgi:hypothetical protein
METLIERPLLYPPMKTPRGWSVVYQPDYKTPCVFNLHERGMFAGRPSIRTEYGARIVTDKNLHPAVQYMYLTDETIEDPMTGKKYSCLNRHGLVLFTDKMKPDFAVLKGKGIEEKVQEEIRRVVEEWQSSFGSKQKGDKPDQEEMRTALKAALERGDRLCQQWLINSNTLWVQPRIPGMIHFFDYGIYQRVAEELYADYCWRGGEETEKELIKKINLFIRLYESDGLIKPNGDLWLSEDELWDCWVAFSGSESEANRICATIEAVLVPLREEIEKELKEAA